MLRPILLAAVAAVATTPAFAGGVPGESPAPVMLAPAPVTTDWGGFYGGVQLEYGEATAAAGLGSVDLDGMNYGIFGGYRVDYGTTVFGFEIDIVSSDMSVSGGVGEVDTISRATLELGYDAGNALIYGTVGVVGMSISPSAPFDDDDWGFVGGVGVDYRLGASSFIAAELLYHQIDDFSGSGTDIDATTLGVGIGFQF